MAIIFQLLVITVFTLFVCIQAAEPNVVYMGGFHQEYGLTGCLSPPSRGCVDGQSGDTCYKDRGLDFSITGTAPICEACMPKNYRNIATYSQPMFLPCALWRYYGCDDHFVTFVWNKSGNNVCFLGGMKSYNMYNQYDGASGNEQEYIKACRQFKTLAAYGLPADTQTITEGQFCSPYKQNITMEDAKTQTLMPSYEEYFDNKFGTNNKIAV